MLIEGIDFLDLFFELTIFYLLGVFLYNLVKRYALPLLYAELDLIKNKEKDLVRNTMMITLVELRKVDTELLVHCGVKKELKYS